MPDDAAAAAERWLRWAREDLKLAEHVAADPEVVARGACAWAQQAAEKALKALIVSTGADPPKIHDLTRLSGLCGNDAGALTHIDLAELTHWSIDGRYPEDGDDATRDDARIAVDAARKVLEIVEVRLSTK